MDRADYWGADVKKTHCPKGHDKREPHGMYVAVKRDRYGERVTEICAVCSRAKAVRHWHNRKARAVESKCARCKTEKSMPGQSYCRECRRVMDAKRVWHRDKGEYLHDLADQYRPKP